MRSWRRAVACLGLVGSMSSAGAQDIQAVDEGIVADPLRWMELVFTVVPQAPVEPALRAAAEEIAKAHKARLPGLLKTWLAQERAAMGSDAPPEQLSARLHARLANELALWRLRDGGRAFDDAWLALLERPQACRGLGKHGYYSDLVLLWQSAPASRRTALLDAERRLLEAWSADPPRVPPRPAPSATDALHTAIARAPIPGGGVRLPMPPILAANLFKDDVKIGELRGSVQCAVHQWGLRQALAQPGARRDQAWLAWRYAMLPRADLWYSQAEPEPDDGEYPKFAQHWQVEGRVMVELRLDAQGQPQPARVLSRAITVPGVRGVPPVAFETLLDERSIARAQRASAARTGAASPRIEIVWRLE